jgi:alpha-galactosidase
MRTETFQQDLSEILAEDPPITRTHEYGSNVIEAMETDRPISIVPNRGVIDKLPDGRCGEVPCLVDDNGCSQG